MTEQEDYAYDSYASGSNDSFVLVLGAILLPAQPLFTPRPRRGLRGPAGGACTSTLGSGCETTMPADHWREVRPRVQFTLMWTMMTGIKDPLLGLTTLHGVQPRVFTLWLPQCVFTPWPFWRPPSTVCFGDLLNYRISICSPTLTH